MRLSKPIEPEAKPPPPPPAVYGLPGSRPARFAPSSPGFGLPLPRRGSAVSVPLSPFLFRSVGSSLRRSPPSAGRVFPRSAGRVFPVLGGSGLPSFSRGRGRGLGFRAVCAAGSAVRSGALPSPLILLETIQTFYYYWRRICCVFRGYSAPCHHRPPPAFFRAFLRSSPLLPLPSPGFARSGCCARLRPPLLCAFPPLGR
jgi:hypothetical protein